MATEQWRNVNAPNFSGSLDGYRIAADLFGKAAQSGQQLITDRETRIDDQNQRQLLERMSGLTTPEQFAAAQASGALTQGMSNMSPAAFAAMTGYGKQLADTANVNARTAGTNVGTQAVQQQMTQAQVLEAERTRQNQANEAYWVQNETDPLRRAAMGNMGVAQGTQLQQGIRNDLRNENARQATDELIASSLGSNYRAAANGDPSRALALRQMDWEEQNRQIQMKLRDVTNPVDRALEFNKLSPQEQEIAQMYEPGGFGRDNMDVQNIRATMGTSPAATSGPAAGFNRTVADVPSPRPISQMTIGDLQSYQETTMKPATMGNASLGLSKDNWSTAVGGFQITSSTLDQYAPKVLGANWKSQPFSAENQEKIAKAIYEDRRGGDLTKTWAGLKGRGMPAEYSAEGHFKNVPWEQVRGLITQQEIGQDLFAGSGAPFGAPGNAGPATDGERIRADIGGNGAAGVLRENTLGTQNQMTQDRANQMRALQAASSDKAINNLTDAKTELRKAFPNASEGELESGINTAINAFGGGKNYGLAIQALKDGGMARGMLWGNNVNEANLNEQARFYNDFTQGTATTGAAAVAQMSQEQITAARGKITEAQTKLAALEQPGVRATRDPRALAYEQTQLQKEIRTLQDSIDGAVYNTRAAAATPEAEATPPAVPERLANVAPPAPATPPVPTARRNMTGAELRESLGSLRTNNSFTPEQLDRAQEQGEAAAARVYGHAGNTQADSARRMADDRAQHQYLEKIAQENQTRLQNADRIAAEQAAAAQAEQQRAATNRQQTITQVQNILASGNERRIEQMLANPLYATVMNDPRVMVMLAQRSRENPMDRLGSPVNIR